MSMWCRLGLHRWRFRDTRTGYGVVTRGRCLRHGCRYTAWTVVNVERKPW